MVTPGTTRNWVVWIVGTMVLLGALWSATLRRTAPTSVSLSPTNASTLAMPVWKRIRLHTYDELEKSFDVVKELLDHPDHGEALEELTFNRIRRYVRYEGEGSLCGGIGDYSEVVNLTLAQEKSAEDEQLERLIDKTSVPVDLRERIVRAMVWKQQNRNPHTFDKRDASNWAYYRHDEHYEYASAAFVLLCAMAPNLRRINTIDLNHGLIALFLTEVNRNRTVSPILTKLETVRLFVDEDGPTYADGRFYNSIPILSNIQYFHHLPSLSTIQVQAVTDDHNDMATIAPGLSPVRNISIMHSGFNSDMLCHLIRLPRKLESITLTSGGRSVERGHTFSIHPKSLGKSLEQHKGSLQYVDLDLDQYLYADHVRPPPRHGSEGAEVEDEYDPPWSGYEDGRSPDEKADEEESQRLDLPLDTRDLPDTKPYGETIGSFADFDQLRTLKIGMKLLLGPYDGCGPTKSPPNDLIEMFPQGLQSLELRGYWKGANKDWDDHIDEFLALRSEKLPHLVSVRGIYEGIPSGEDVDDPDTDTDLLFKVPEEDDGWLTTDGTG